MRKHSKGQKRLTGNLEVRLPFGWVNLLESIQSHHEQIDLLLIVGVIGPLVDVLTNTNFGVIRIVEHWNACDGVIGALL